MTLLKELDITYKIRRHISPSVNTKVKDNLELFGSLDKNIAIGTDEGKDNLDNSQYGRELLKEAKI